MSDETPATVQGAEGATADVMTVVASKVKQVVKAKGLRSDGNLVDALNVKVIAMIGRAADRAKADGRATVRPQDLDA